MSKSLFILMLSILGFIGCNAQRGSSIDSKEAYGLIKADSNIAILDVRTAKEFADGHVAGAVNIDVNQTDFAQKIDELDRSKTYIVYCRLGRRSRKAVGIMAAKGFKNLYNVSDGFVGWNKNGLPFEK
ncbi:phage shock protein E [Bacteroidetes oral taxon 274 str. F0058]|nr:phage shock protein E [Bacteroidetes oral taxon 274 str. F0058]